MGKYIAILSDSRSINKTKKSTVAKLYSHLHGARHPIFKILIDQGIASP